MTKLLILATFLFTALAHAQYQTPNAPLLGAAWYPEQWPESQWERDLQLMQDAHMNVVRIGEFAWSSMEPIEGHYDLAWLDRAIALAAQHHLKVVLGTPTDAPPAWLTTHYPDTLGMNPDGRYREHGGRRQFNYASPRYRQLCALIVAQLAQRYGHNPNILGWQIGNEYTDESFDPVTRAQFQQFLKAKYKTLASLNDHWATAYWSQTYTAWSQIPMAATNGNPGLLLDHKHFVTATWRSFQRNQIDTLRHAILPTQFLTTNIGGLAWSDNWDHYALTADLDLASWDDYVGQGHLQVPRNAMLNDFARGWKRQNFWVMETQPGSVNWAPINNVLAPGETRALAWQTIGRGADAVLYWQWRDALNGQEQYHGAIAGPDGNPLPIYAEIQQLGADLDLTRAAIAGTQPHAEIALLHDYDSRWAIDFQPHTKEYDQQQIMVRFYTALARHGTIDIVEPKGDLNRYKLIVAPSLNVLSQATATKLLAYVQQGGHLILGPRSGMKDEYNSLNPDRQPGPLAAALGGKVTQYYALDESITLDPIPMPPGGDVMVGGKAQIWAEDLTPTSPETRTVLTYNDPGGWLDKKPAMLSHDVGVGTIAYLGTLPDTGILAILMTEAATDAGIAIDPYHQLPPGIERAVRSNVNTTVTILINHNSRATSVPLPHPMRNLLAPTAPAAQTIDLPPQGIAVLEATP